MFSHGDYNYNHKIRSYTDVATDQVRKVSIAIVSKGSTSLSNKLERC